jgi:hypothetical protein
VRDASRQATTSTHRGVAHERELDVGRNRLGMAVTADESDRRHTGGNGLGGTAASRAKGAVDLRTGKAVPHRCERFISVSPVRDTLDLLQLPYMFRLLPALTSREFITQARRRGVFLQPSDLDALRDSGALVPFFWLAGPRRLGRVPRADLEDASLDSSVRP